MWIDRPGTNKFLRNYKNQKIITQINNVDSKDSNLNIEMLFEPGVDLYGGCSVALYALDWCYKKRL